MTLLISGGNVFLENNFVKSEILVDGCTIAKIGNISPKKGMEVLNAEGKYLIPGLIDIHVHFRDFGESKKETWVSGSMAAASGGITTVLDMPNNKKPVVTMKMLEIKKKKVSEKSLVNFGLYMAVTDKNIDEINRSGVKFVKLYYGATTGDIMPGDVGRIFKELHKDAMIVVHAEDNFIISQNKLNFSEADKKYHSMIRDNRSEFTAVHDLIELSHKHGRKLHITHVSTKEALLLIRQAKAKGLKITCDTCPHYLFLDDSAYAHFGNKAKVNPSLKSRQDRDMLWRYLEEGVIDCICSDHAPHTLPEKSSIIYESCPSGFPGVETTLQLMLTAVREKRISLENFIKLMTVNPSKIFNIRTKGRIKEGYDADLAVLDLDRIEIIRGKTLFTKARWSPFEGFETTGKAVMTIINGKIIFEHNRFKLGSNGKEVR